MKKKHNILFCYVSIAIFLSLLVLVGCPSPPNNDNTIATPTSAKQRLRLNTTNKILTFSFNKNIKSIKTPENISVYKKSTNTPDSTKNELDEDKHAASAVKGKLVITLKDELTAGESFYVQMQKDTIIYKDDTSNAHPITSPTVTVPMIFVTKVEIDKAIFTLSFNISLSDKDKNKIKVYKNNTPLTSSDYTVAIDGTDATKIKITLTAAELTEGDTYKVQFKPDAVQSINGIGNDAITTNEVSVLLPPALQSKALERTGNTLTVTFKNAIEITDNSKITVYKNNKNSLTLSKDYTVAIDDTDKTKVKITLTAAELNEGDTYKVQFKPNAVQSTNGISNDTITTNKVSVLLSPALTSNDLALKGNTLTIKFKKAIKITDKNKIKVYKNNTPLTSSDYTVAIDGTNSTKIKITLTASPSLKQKYQVKFLVSAVRNIANNQPNKFMETNEYDTIKIWKHVATSAGWTARVEHTSVVFKNQIWVLGGNDGSKKNDVWSSSNGKDWTEVTTTKAKWSGRFGHTSVVFKNKIWVLGGYDGKNRKNDVWSSSNGKDWTKVTDAPWSGRTKHTTVMFKDKIWVLGGRDNKDRKNDVWNSNNGKDWKKVTDAPWSGRTKHTAVVFKNKTWVLGGRDNKNRKNDVWSSSDGVIWTEVTNEASWTDRDGHTSMAFDGKIWGLGGRHNKDRKNDDVWSSSDGVIWKEETATADWSARYDHTMVAFKNKIWVLGGNDGSKKNDVWTYGLP